LLLLDTNILPCGRHQVLLHGGAEASMPFPQIGVASASAPQRVVLRLRQGLSGKMHALIVSLQLQLLLLLPLCHLLRMGIFSPGIIHHSRVAQHAP
jgi:hypothetical protein